MLLGIIAFVLHDCPSVIDNATHTWCKINKTGHHWIGVEQTVIYLHHSSDSNIEITHYQSNGNYKLYDLNPGKSITFIGSNILTKCKGDKCIATVWNTIYGKDKAYYVSDAAGALYYGDKVCVMDRYVSFFDFGPSTRMEIEYQYHPRSTGLEFYYQLPNRTVIEHVIELNQTGRITLDSPGILKFSSSPYFPFSFRIIIGSPIQLPSFFSNNPSYGPIYTVNADGTTDNRETDENDIYVHPAKEITNWKYGKIMGNAATALILLVSILNSSRFFPKKSPVEESSELIKDSLLL